MTRYDRQIALWGAEGQKKLSDASVLVVGAGGLGVPVLQYLAAAGVGLIGIADGDVVDISNIHRQPLYDADEAGRNKARVAAEKLYSINSDTNTSVYPFMLESANIRDVLKGYHVVVDASDNFPARYLLDDACFLDAIPLVYGGVSSMEGQWSVFHFNDGPGYRDLYPQSPKDGAIPNCASTGIMGTVPAVVGSLMATEVLKILTGAGEPVSGKLMTWHAGKQAFHSFSFSKGSHERPVNWEQLRQTDYPAWCGVEGIRSVSAEEWDKVFTFDEVIDIREPHELPPAIDRAQRFPLSLLEQGRHPEALSGKVLVYCQTGNRSSQAIRLLEKPYPDLAFFALEGGIKAWQLYEMNKHYGRT